MAATRVLEARAVRRVGSSPISGTNARLAQLVEAVVSKTTCSEFKSRGEHQILNKK
jgi:hypothetical protein